MLGILAGLGASIVSSAVSAGINNANAQRANQVQRDMQRDAMMYNKQQSDIAYQRDSLANKVRQLREAGFSPSLAVDYNQNSNAPSVSAPSAHMANSPSVDASPFTSAVQAFQQREFDRDLQRAQVLSLLSQSDLNAEQKKLVNQQLLDLVDQKKYRELDYNDRHVNALKANELVDAQIQDMKDRVKLENDKLEHQKLDDAEKNKIQREIGLLNNDIKTFEYFFKKVQEFLSSPKGSKSLEDAKKLWNELNNAPEAFKKKIKEAYGSFDNWLDDVFDTYVGFNFRRGFHTYKKRDGIRYDVGHY